jgi:hypothetical protein
LARGSDSGGTLFMTIQNKNISSQTLQLI